MLPLQLLFQLLRSLYEDQSCLYLASVSKSWLLPLLLELLLLWLLQDRLQGASSFLLVCLFVFEPNE